MRIGSKLVVSLVVLGLLFTVGAVSAHAVTLEFWTNETTEERLAVTREIIADFEAAYPDIQVVLVPVHESDLPQKLSATIAARRLPQVLLLGAEHVMFLGKEGLLDGQVAENVISSIGREDFLEGPIRMTSVREGEIVAVPFHGWVQGIWYRTDWFEEVGLAAPTTWEAIRAAAEYFYNPAERVYGIGVGTKKDHFATQAFTQFAFSNNAYMFDVDGNLAFNSPEMVEAIAFYKELAGFGAPGPQDYRDGRALYMSDQLAMIVYSSFFMGTLEANAPHLVDKTGFASVMEHTGKATYGQVMSIGVPVTATPAQKEAAEKFIKFLMEPEQYIKYVHMAPGGMLPVRRSIAADERYYDNPLLQLFGEQAADLIAGLDVAQAFGFEHGKIFPRVGEIAARFVIGDAFTQMIDQGWSAEQTAEWAHQRMKSVLGQ